MSSKTSKIHGEGTENPVNELDPDLFQACLHELGRIPYMEAVMGATMARRGAFGQVQAAVIPGFQVLYGNDQHHGSLESAHAEGYEVVVVAKEVVKNRVGALVPSYVVLWRNTTGTGPDWHENVVVLDRDSAKR